jgi:hypothetical protein
MQETELLMAEDINNHNVAPNTPPPLPIVQQNSGADMDTYEESPVRRWLLLAAFGVGAILIAILLVLGGRWTYNKIFHHSNKAVTITTKQPNKTPTTTLPGTTPAPTTPSGQNNQPAPSTGNNGKTNLPNNGPGGNVAIFVSVTLAASALHYVIALRKNANQLD